MLFSISYSGITHQVADKDTITTTFFSGDSMTNYSQKTPKTFLYAMYLLLATLLLGTPPPAAVCGTGLEEKSITTEVNTKTQKTLIDEGQEGQNITQLQTITASDWVYNIISDTEVYIGESMQRVSMDELPIPCQAEIVYQPLPNNVRNALIIRVLQIAPNATKDWPALSPQ